MKDPLILCHICNGVGVHFRQKSGIRCGNAKCGLFREKLATEQEVQELKRLLRGSTWNNLKSWIHDLNSRDYTEAT